VEFVSYSVVSKHIIPHRYWQNVYSRTWQNHTASSKILEKKMHCDNFS